MIWLRVFMFVLAIYYVMLILQVITGLTWTAKKVTFGRFIIPFYFWFTINSKETDKEQRQAIRNSSDEVLVEHDGEWIPESEYNKMKDHE